LKKDKYHIVCSRILLICFAAGQFMIYAHQHPVSPALGKQFAASRAAIAHQTVKEKCDLCDVMHHNAMVASHYAYLNPVAVCVHVYKDVDYNFTSIQLILAGGRAPPSHLS
jgi:hypothetical protein